jgi:hypothetical protein
LIVKIDAKRFAITTGSGFHAVEALHVGDGENIRGSNGGVNLEFQTAVNSEQQSVCAPPLPRTLGLDLPINADVKLAVVKS